MFTGVPTRPADAWHGVRAETIHHLECTIPGISDESRVKDLNRSGLLIEVTSTPKVGTSHVAMLVFGGCRVELPVRVSHVSTRYEPGEGPRHRVGLVFRLQRDADYQALDELLERLNRPTSLGAAA